MTEPIGLPRGTVKVVSYNPAWPALFEEEKHRLEAALGASVHGIQHVGSTAVPGLAAKPIIDIIAAIDDLADYRQFIEPLTTLGYEYMPERVFADRIFFPKGPRDNRTYHLSLVVKNSKGWLQPITFRDYLAKNTAARQSYEALKKELAAKYPDDRAAYTKAKEQAIQKLLNASTGVRL